MIFVPIYHKSVFKNPFSHLTHIYTLAYKQIETKIESLENSRLISGENGYVVCNATYSVNFDTNLHWKIQHTEKSVLSINNGTIVTDGENLAADPVSLSPSQLSGLCQEFGPQLEEGMVAFSINYAPAHLLRFNSAQYNRALVQRQLLVLVMCNVGLDQIGTYTCIAPGNGVSQEQTLGVSVYVQETDNSGNTNIPELTNGTVSETPRPNIPESNGNNNIVNTTTSGTQVDVGSLNVVLIAVIVMNYF